MMRYNPIFWALYIIWPNNRIARRVLHYLVWGLWWTLVGLIAFISLQ